LAAKKMKGIKMKQYIFMARSILIGLLINSIIICDENIENKKCDTSNTETTVIKKAFLQKLKSALIKLSKDCLPLAISEVFYAACAIYLHEFGHSLA
jgi:hypothetical protein